MICCSAQSLKHSWISQMIRSILAPASASSASCTPGQNLMDHPIVITSTFVGYLLYGWSGAIVATVAIFTPSFFMIVALAPVFERLKASAYFNGATKGILASFVGLLFFVCLKFAMAVPWEGIRVLMVLAAFTA